MGECEFVVYCQESVNTELELWKKEVQRRGGGALHQRARASTVALPGSEPPSRATSTSTRKASSSSNGLVAVGETGGEDVAQLKAELTELKFAFFNHAVSWVTNDGRHEMTSLYCTKYLFSCHFKA